MAKSTEAPGVIDAHAAYELGEFSRRTRLGTWALRQARRSGLRVCTVGSRRFVLGSDWLAYLARIEPEGTEMEQRQDVTQ